MFQAVIAVKPFRVRMALMEKARGQSVGEIDFESEDSLGVYS